MAVRAALTRSCNGHSISADETTGCVLIQRSKLLQRPPCEQGDADRAQDQIEQQQQAADISRIHNVYFYEPTLRLENYFYNENNSAKRASVCNMIHSSIFTGFLR
jgi:hypothetical protein